MATDVHFSHDGKLVALGFTLWDATLPADPVFTYPTVPSDCDPGISRFSADDSELRCVGSDGTFHSLDISQLAAHDTQASSIYTAAAASQNGSTIAIPESDHTEIWSTAPLAKRTDLTLPGGENVLLSPDGRLIAIQKSQDELEVWDLTRDTRLGTLPGNLGGFTKTVAFSPVDTGYVTYDRTENLGPQGVVNSLRFYDLRTMKLIRQDSFTLKASVIDFSTTVAFQPDGRAVTISPLLGTVAFPSGAILVHGTPDLHLNGYGPRRYDGLLRPEQHPHCPLPGRPADCRRLRRLDGRRRNPPCQRDQDLGSIVPPAARPCSHRHQGKHPPDDLHH